MVGDLHSSWGPEDVSFFNASAYEMLLVTGDLGRTRTQDGRRIARSLAQLKQDVLVMPGNNDVEEYPHIQAELTYRRARADLLELDADGGAHHEPARLCGYSLHPLALQSLPLTLIAARPFAMGGGELSFPQALARTYGVHSMQQSIERLRALVDRAPTEQLVFFAHNGPFGLGGAADDPWGRDFAPEAGDWGDPDLADAIGYARAQGKKVLAVVAGHMHWQLRDRPGQLRRWQLLRDGTLYVNAARVPRAFAQHGGAVRSHVCLQLTAAGASAHEVLIVDGG